MSTAGGHIQVDGQRVILLSDGVLWGKDGLNGAWHKLNTSVDEAAMSSDLVVIRQGNSIWGKAGLTEAWVLMSTAGGHIQVDGQRVILLSDGVLWGKDGLNGAWHKLNTSVDEAAMSSDLVVIRQGNLIWGKAGLTEAWVLMSTAGGHIQVDGQRVILLSDGVLWGKDGLNGAWHKLNTSVDEAAIHRNGLLTPGTVPPTSAPPQGGSLSPDSDSGVRPTQRTGAIFGIKAKRLNSRWIRVSWKAATAADHYRTRVRKPNSGRTKWAAVKDTHVRVRLPRGKHAVLALQAVGSSGGGPVTRRRL